MIISPQVVYLVKENAQAGVDEVKACEKAARNCYASIDKMTDTSYKRFAKALITRGHEAPIEFGDLTFELTTSRAVLAELTRHRLASFCVESQRYIQEAATGDITFIKPVWYDEENICTKEWLNQMEYDEKSYKKYVEVYGMKPEEAREILPNSTACHIFMKANLREWRHIFELRCSPAAYPQMQELAKEMLRQAHEYVPVVFDDIYEKYFRR